MTESLLAGWDNFYVIVGSAAAGLTGLTFVVIALAADAHRVNPTGLRAFVTPTVVHFASVLGIAAFLTMPGHTGLTLAVGLAAGGLAGLSYCGVIGLTMHRNRKDYVPVGEDWTFHVLTPVLSYLTLFAMAFLFYTHPKPALYAVAAVSLLLLYTGIHNAWDIAVWMSVNRKQR